MRSRPLSLLLLGPLLFVAAGDRPAAADRPHPPHLIGRHEGFLISERDPSRSVPLVLEIQAQKNEQIYGLLHVGDPEEGEPLVLTARGKVPCCKEKFVRSKPHVNAGTNDPPVRFLAIGGLEPMPDGSLLITGDFRLVGPGERDSGIVVIVIFPDRGGGG